MLKNKKQLVEENTNEALEVIASFLLDDTKIDTKLPCRDFLQVDKLNYSLESLMYVEEYILKFKEVRGTFNDGDQDIITVALRCGAYTGEVIRKNAQKKFEWLTFDQAVNKCNFPKDWESLSSIYVLNYDNNAVTMPIGKVLKFLDNGEEDSLFFFAKFALQNSENEEHAETVKTTHGSENVNFYPLAGFWRRFIAFAVDQISAFFMIVVIYFVAASIYKASSSEDVHILIPQNENHTGIILLFSTLFSVVFYFYNRISLQAKTGQSIGKKLLGLYIYSDDGKFMSIKQAVIKEFSYCLEFVVGAFIMIFRKDKKRISDIIAGTSVYYKESKANKIYFWVFFILTVCLLSYVPVIIATTVTSTFNSPIHLSNTELLNKGVSSKEKDLGEKSIEQVLFQKSTEVNGKTAYPLHMWSNIYWTGTHSDREHIVFEYMIDDTITKIFKSDIYGKELDGLLKNNRKMSLFYTCQNQEAVDLLGMGAILRHRFFLNGEIVGLFDIRKDDCQKHAIMNE